MRGGKEVQTGDTILYCARERIANAQDITGENRILQNTLMIKDTFGYDKFE